MRTTNHTPKLRGTLALVGLIVMILASCTPSDGTDQALSDWRAQLDEQWRRLITQSPTPVGTGGNPATPTTTRPASTTTPPKTTTTIKLPSSQSSTTVPASPAPSGSLTFADEFNGSTLDTSVWEPYYNSYGDGNNELQCETPNNVAVSGGTLKITARRETINCPGGGVRNFTAGFLGTRETGHYFPRYGRFEMRAKLPHGQGLWPAFWLRHRNGAGTAEVDIMEYFHASVPGQSTGTLHLDGRKNLIKKSTPFETPTTSPGWHTWAVDILPDPSGVKFSFMVDSKVYLTYVDTQHYWSSADANATWDIAVNMSVGGDWVGNPDDALGYLGGLNRCAQGGTPPNGCTSTGILRTSFPSTYEVDYVRVYAA
jgi:beta-glucanase (GH16 family)